MRTSLFARFAALLTVLGLLLVMASPASAGQPRKITIHDEFNEDLCGIPVYTTVDGWFTQHIQYWEIEPTTPDADNFFIGVIQVHLDVAWTTADGEVLTTQLRRTIQEGDLVDLGDGYWEYTYTVNGLVDKIRLGNEILVMEVGSISIREVIYLGDLSTVDDFEFISFEVTDSNGPHPLTEADHDLFCEVITGAIG
jgi:hypothetical protein